MHVLIAADKFKDALSSDEVNQALAAGVRQVRPDAAFTCLPVSDGGEGFLSAVASLRPDAVVQETPSEDPLGRAVLGKWLWEPATRSVWIEMAQVSGLQILADAERNPERTSTRGTGLLIQAALELNPRDLWIGIGGSATNDGGVGMAAALGVQFLDRNGIPVEARGDALSQIDTIQLPDKPLGSGTRFHVINDVSNPLFGSQGAAHIFAPQKGATTRQVEQLDLGLRHLDRCVQTSLGKQLAEVSGAGAAGGLGYGLQVFLNARFAGGAETLLNWARVEDQLEAGKIDWVLTGEGRLDSQTCLGKWIAGLAGLARGHRVPVQVFCGQSSLSSADQQTLGLSGVVAIHDPELRTVKRSMELSRTLLEEAAARWAREVLV